MNQPPYPTVENPWNTEEELNNALPGYYLSQAGNLWKKLETTSNLCWVAPSKNRYQPTSGVVASIVVMATTDAVNKHHLTIISKLIDAAATIQSIKTIINVVSEQQLPKNNLPKPT